MAQEELSPKAASQISSARDSSSYADTWTAGLENSFKTTEKNDDVSVALQTEVQTAGSEERAAIFQSISRLNLNERNAFNNELEKGQLTFPPIFPGETSAIGATPTDSSKWSTNGNSGEAPGDPSIKGMADWFEDNFEKLDQDKDGFLTKPELERALLDPVLATGHGAAYLTTVHDKTSEWCESFGLAPISEGKFAVALTRENIGKMRDTVMKQENTEVAEKLGIGSIQADMGHIDDNGDHCITRKELDAALKDDHWSPQQRQNLERLKEKFTEVAKVNKEGTGFGPKYGTDLDCEFVSEVDLELLSSRQSVFSESLKQSLELAVEHTKVEHAIDQQGTSSCFLLAPLEALQRQNPEAIDRMIKDNGDGTVSVTFPGDPKRPVTIAKPTEGEQTAFTKGKAGVIEKAFAQYLSKLPPQDQQEYLTGEPKTPMTLIQQKLDKGGYSKATMALLTGAHVDRFPKSEMQPEEILQKLEASAAAEQLVTIGTIGPVDPTSGIYPKHGYSVSFDPKTKSITLTNPDKTGRCEPANVDGSPVDGKFDGSFTVTLEQFAKYTDNIFVGEATDTIGRREASKE